jgi:hypothetical protein
MLSLAERGATGKAILLPSGEKVSAKQTDEGGATG